MPLYEAKPATLPVVKQSARMSLFIVIDLRAWARRLAVFQEQAARFGQSATRARKRVGTRRVGFYAPARPYAFCSSSRRAARPPTLESRHEHALAQL